MTIQDLDPTIKEVAEAYRLNIKVDTIVNQIAIESDYSKGDYHFYWDTSYSKQDFFNDLRDYFEKTSPYNR